MPVFLPRRLYGVAAALLLVSHCSPAYAQPMQSGPNGKLLLTGGVSSIDGAAGGGLTPWAVTGSYATTGEIGATAFASGVKTKAFALAVYGAAVAFGERVELSLAHQDFNAKDNLAPLGLRGLHLKQNIAGAKLRIAGDAVLDSDTWMPQMAIGVQHKKTDAGALGPTLFGPLGAKAAGTDVYISATKLLLAPGVLVNVTLRATKANQNGLLGFGGAQASSTKLMPEVSAAKLLAKNTAIGAEYRAKPDNLNQSVCRGCAPG